MSRMSTEVDNAELAEAYDRDPLDNAIVTYVQLLASLTQPVKLRSVSAVDNQGEPCEYCSLLGRDIQATLHGNQEGRAASADCCIPCIPTVAASEFDAEVTVVAEIAA